MNDLIKLDVVNGKPSATSLQVAEHFGKEHKNVLRDIRDILDQDDDGFGRLNFEVIRYSSELGNGITRNNPAYAMIRDGFTLLVMGYTGKEAMRWKKTYIAAFNAMEAELRARNEKPMLPDDYIAALRALADAEEEKKLALEQREYYKRTKAEIGTRREATAMNTASQLSKKVNTLQDALGEGKTWKAVKSIDWLEEYFCISQGLWSQIGKKLSVLSQELGYSTKRLETPEYPVRLYHVDVIDKLKERLEAVPDMLWKYRKAA